MQKSYQNICTCQKIAVLLCGISVKRITKSHLKSSAASEKHMLFLATARRGCSKFFFNTFPANDLKTQTHKKGLN